MNDPDKPARFGNQDPRDRAHDWAARYKPPETRRWKPDGRRDYWAEIKAQGWLGAFAVFWMALIVLAPVVALIRALF